MTERTALVVGASSGIGRELARVLAREGYTVGLTARRENRLEGLADELPTTTSVRRMDVSKPLEARALFEDLAAEMNGIDLVILCAGVGHSNPNLDWEPEQMTIETNVVGFVALATAAINHFEARGGGHLVGISSLAALRGNPSVPAYSASKAFVSNYLEGLRVRARNRESDVTVTDIQPGFVDTAMADGAPAFAASSPTAAAGDIYDAIVAKRPHAYVTRRWRPVAWLMRFLPEEIYARLVDP